VLDQDLHWGYRGGGAGRIPNDVPQRRLSHVRRARAAKGVESVGSCWNSTTVFQRRDHVRKSIHSHWSFTRHAAFQSMTPEASEGLV